MAELGGTIASALLTVVGQQIGSAIEGQIKLQQNFNEDLEKMKMTLETVEAVLKEAEKRSITDELVRLWLKRLKDAMYAISDMIDDFEAGTDPARKFSRLAVIIPCLTIVPEIKMANKMKKVRDHVTEIAAQHNDFSLMGGAGVNGKKVIDARETTSLTLKVEIIERTNEEQKILVALSKSIKEQTIFIPIFGIGGLGKTTMAKVVYNNNSEFQGYSRVWVYVSQTFYLKKIGKSIIAQLSGNECQYTELQMIQSSVKNLLVEKKNILIVLDDLWEENDVLLNDLKAMLTVEKNSKVVVVVTTRDEGIAKKMSSQPHKLAPLTDDMCWTIIKQKCDFENRDDKAQLERIGMDIAKKCRGMGLAAQSLGYMLNSLKSDEWEAILRDNDISSVSACLELSYTSMPSFLKLCFAYCAIFPKGHKIIKDDLIHQWVCLGFIEPSRKFSCWQLCEKYITQLLGMSFLEHSKSSSTARAHIDDIKSFTMHDLVHDLARSVMDDEILLAAKDRNTGGSYCHYALLSDSSKPLKSPRIRALGFMDSTEIGLHDAVFSSAQSLRVLDFSECSIHKLPDSIGRLKQLRYLNAPKVQHSVIPDSITRLTKLVYLSLRGSSTILALPKSIGEMEGLKYLDLSGCLRIQNLPESFGKLKKLLHLDLSNCSDLENISKFLGNLTGLQYLNLTECACIGELPTSLGGLSDLQYLNLSYSSYICGCTQAEVLGSLTKLEYLNLSSRISSLKQLPESLSNFVKLKYLILSGCVSIEQLPKSFGNLKSLVHLDLKRCCRVKYVLKDFEGLINLQYLNLSACMMCLTENLVVQLMDRITTFSSLEHLDLSHNLKISSLPESIGNLGKLHTLDLSACMYLREIPETIGTIGSLKLLYLEGCDILSYVPPLGTSSLSLPLFVVHAGDGDSCSNLILLQDTNPVELKLRRLENVKSQEEARSIKLVEKEGLEDLTLEWTRDANGFVDDEVLLETLVPPSNLRSLKIQGYNGVSVPVWVSHLPNLETLELSNMEHLKEWTSTSEYHDCAGNASMLPVIQNLKIEDCPKLRMKTFLPRAIKLRIKNSDNVLASWGEIGASSSSCSVTTDLTVKECELPLHQWRLLRHLPGLANLSISLCSDLTGSPDIIQHMSSVESLCLYSETQEDLPKWLCELASLKSLAIEGPRRKEKLDENVRKLTKLQKLRLEGNSVSSLPDWLTELTCLEHLVISWNYIMMSLPENIQQLTNLRKLEIRFCGELKEWCELEENEMKLTHIKEKVIRNY